MHGKQLAKSRGQRRHHRNASGYAKQSAGETKAERLQQKDAQQVGGIRADGFENGQHVHALFEMRMHGHGHADCAQNHRDQTNEAQNGGRVVEPTGERRVALTEVHYLRVWQRRFQLRAHRGGFGVQGKAFRRHFRELDKQTPGGAAAWRQQPCRRPSTPPRS